MKKYFGANLKEFYPGHREYDRSVLIGEIRDMRNEAGLTQKEFAEKIGTTQSAVARIECGRQNVGIDLLAKIAGAMGKKLRIYFS